MKYTIGHMRQFTSIGLIVTCLLSSVSVLGTNLTGKRIYINPGHGSWGSDDRPLATIPYPNLPTSGMPDTLGFYESNTNLWKCMYLGQKLEAAGAKVFYSRTANGPWDYEMVDGDYPTYNAANYLNRSDYHKYNKNLWTCIRKMNIFAANQSGYVGRFQDGHRFVNMGNLNNKMCDKNKPDNS